MTEQKVVRTSPDSSYYLSDVLSRGYKVVMCTEIKDSYGTVVLEYIVEKEKEDE